MLFKIVKIIHAIVHKKSNEIKYIKWTSIFIHNNFLKIIFRYNFSFTLLCGVYNNVY